MCSSRESVSNSGSNKRNTIRIECRCKDKLEEYETRKELRNTSEEKEFACGKMSLKNTNRHIEEERNRISNTEKYSYEEWIFEGDCEEVDHRKMKEHPYKSHEYIRIEHVLDTNLIIRLCSTNNRESLFSILLDNFLSFYWSCWICTGSI